jgi:hypothetical protein
MSMTITTPWGDEDGSDPDFAARLFAYTHWRAGHRYTVTGPEGSMQVECECGKRSQPGQVDFP